MNKKQILKEINQSIDQIIIKVKRTKADKEAYERLTRLHRWIVAR